MNMCMCSYKHMHVSSAACVLNMIMNDLLIMTAYLCLTVFTLGPPPMYVQALAVLANTASVCSMAFCLRARRPCNICISNLCHSVAKGHGHSSNVAAPLHIVYHVRGCS